MIDFFRTILFLPRGASSIAEDIDLLHISIITVTMLGAAGVFAVAIAFTFKYRRRTRDEYTPIVRAPIWYETVVIGGLLGLFLMWWVLGVQQYERMHSTQDEAHEVYVTGKQWMWKFAHPEGRSSVGVLVVPRGHPVRLVITSRDVVHSFFVPAFRIKQDAVPGRYTTISFSPEREGTYRALCAEYCGTAHSRMWASVVVLDPAEYESWLDGGMPEPVARASANPRIRVAPFDEEQETGLVEQGEAAAARYGCLNCHTVDGQDHIGPTWLGLFDSRVTLKSGKRVRADEDYLTESMMEPQAKIHSGYETIMPTFKGVLASTDVAAIVEYIKSLETVRPRPEVRLPPVQPAPEGGRRPGARDGGAAIGRDAGQRQRWGEQRSGR